MTENRFFTWVWRFNAIAIALAVSCLLAILMWEFTRDWRRSAFPTQATEVVTANPATSAAEGDAPPILQNARFGAPVDATGPGLYVLPQYVDETLRSGLVAKQSGGNRVNFMVVDTQAQTKSWLFDPETARLITEVQHLWFAPAPGTRTALGSVLHVIEADTNGNGQLSRTDEGTLYYVGPEWTAPIALVSPLRRVIEAKVIGPDTFDVITADATATTLRRFRLPGGEIQLEITLTDAP